MKRTDNRRRGERGFTLLEMSVALVVFAIIAVAVYGVLIRTDQGERMGSTMADAQQNARMALDLMLRDLRQAGYGINENTQVAIETASQYRVTFVVDKNANGITEPGERITYFLDDNADDPIVAATPNPEDYVLRRVISTAGDPAATPSQGAGQVVAYGITQRTPGNNGWDVPMFDFLNAADSSLVGGGTDPLGNQWGNTVADSLLGKPAGSGRTNLVSAIRVDVVAEASYKDPESQQYRQVQVSGTIHPRNVEAPGRVYFSHLTPNGTGGGPGGGGSTPPDTTVTDTTGVDTTATPVLPPEEPPIRIPTERVLSLAVEDLHEQDSKEGSQVTEDNQHDNDIMIGTQSGGTNNLAVWFEGYPDKYSSGRLYNAVPNYRGYSARDINGLVTGALDASDKEYTDVAAAVGVSDVSGGFEIWLNQAQLGAQGWVGVGSPTTTANGYYTSLSGKGQAIALADVDDDGDLDVLLGTRTGANTGAIELWQNSGYGVFTFAKRWTASGEVNALAVADFNDDGWPDFAVGTKTSNSNKDGSVSVWMNRINQGNSEKFVRAGVWSSAGQVKALAAAPMDNDGYPDVVTGTQTGAHSGKIELWRNDGSGNLTKVDEVAADDVVLSVALGPIDWPNTSNDIVAGTAARSVQAWFCDPDATQPSDIIPPAESWADANAGGLVNAVAIAKVEASKDHPEEDLLYDIVAGTAISATSGEIVIYLNPYVWTLGS